MDNQQKLQGLSNLLHLIYGGVFPNAPFSQVEAHLRFIKELSKDYQPQSTEEEQEDGLEG